MIMAEAKTLLQNLVNTRGMIQVMNEKKSLKNANSDGTGLFPSTSLFTNPSL